MVKIISGEARSLRLNSAVGQTRPTSQRVREAIFSRLESLCDISGTSVLDLFAGIGTLGLEALSRGAERVWLVENNAGTFRVLQSNIKLVEHGRSSACDTRAVNKDAGRFLRSAPQIRFNIVFADPPYGYDPRVTEKNLYKLGQWLSPNALLVFETSARDPYLRLPEFFEDLGSKTYGETRVHWGQFVKGSQPNF